MSNRLAKETSPYLLAHKDHPVDWYPWGAEAFERAKREDKPIFLSIGYSACHWCHVLAHESFEDEEIAGLLNRHFISVKVDKEERPDIDSVYMAVCQAFTGSGGWPTSIFMTADQKPFFAGTYFPKTSRGGMIGMRELLLAINEKWNQNREMLLEQADEIIRHLQKSEASSETAEIDLAHRAAEQYWQVYDEKYAGFGRAPKFPTPHNLLFLLDYYERYQTPSALRMAEQTLLQMYRGGMFDHIGFGFCRYSTDKKFLVPHFEKMLYDNALLILAYCKGYAVTKKGLFLEIAEKTADYILREMTAPDGGFYSSQDADSEGVEGKYYLFTPEEIVSLLGKEEGEAFNRHFDITEIGNFEGKNIPNLLKSDPMENRFAPVLPLLCSYRKERYPLYRDEKILTAWNGLMIAAMCDLYLVSKKEEYLAAAKKACQFIEKHLCDGKRLFVSYHMGKRGEKGFLDDYAAFIFALLHLYRATLEEGYLDRAKYWSDRVLAEFRDDAGGFYLYGGEHEELIFRPKESYDGAIPSGNSLMAYNLVCLAAFDGEEYKTEAEDQLDFLAKEASLYPLGHGMFLRALLAFYEPFMKVTIVGCDQEEKSKIAQMLPPEATVIWLANQTKEYPMKNGKTTYYLCRGHSCLPPTNRLPEWI